MLQRLDETSSETCESLASVSEYVSDIELDVHVVNSLLHITAVRVSDFEAMAEKCDNLFSSIQKHFQDAADKSRVFVNDLKQYKANLRQLLDEVCKE